MLEPPNGTNLQGAGAGGVLKKLAKISLQAANRPDQVMVGYI